MIDTYYYRATSRGGIQLLHSEATEGGAFRAAVPLESSLLDGWVVPHLDEADAVVVVHCREGFNPASLFSQKV